MSPVNWQVASHLETNIPITCAARKMYETNLSLDKSIFNFVWTALYIACRVI